MPANYFQRVGDFFEQRREYRAQALKALRKREGLPSPVDEHGAELETRFDDFGNAHYYNADGTRAERVLFAGTGKDGKPGGFAIGTRKGEARELADAHWNSSDPGFEILDVAEDGRKLSEELLDLHRDAATYERADKVSYGDAGEQAPGLVVRDGAGDDEVDEVLQEFLKKGVQRHE
jgi:hypothetical protein